MKTNCWLLLGTMIAASATAQVSTNKLPEIPPPANAAAPAAAPSPAATPVVEIKKAPVAHKRKKIVKKITEAPVALTPGAATVTSANLNLRGQAGMKGEVVGHLKKGDTVNVIAQINLDRHAADEPAQWAKISLPSDIKVWVNTHFVDAANKTVSARKLNLRAGPGENYSVLGVVEKGCVLNEFTNRGSWAQIETPTNAFAYVAAAYLKQAPATETVVPATTTPAPETNVLPVIVPVVPPPTTNTVAETTPVVPVPTTVPTPAPAAENNPPAVTPTPAPVVAENNPPAPVDTNAAPAVTTTNTPVVDTNPPPPRVVSHEGYVRHSVSIVAPTYYELYDWDSGNAINYLFSTSTNLDLSRYMNHKIIVTGEEGISQRWAATPVLTIQKIYVTATNLPVVESVNQSPRAKQNSTPRAGQRH
jgi:uncharacterized protein YgiM (DUF1202 family)